MLKIKPDGVLFVGDLANGDISFVKAIKTIPIPKAVILGNHDHGNDRTGSLLKAQLNLLGDIDCSWRFQEWINPSFSVVGARPCSSGGGFYISKEVQSVFGKVTLEDSVERIVSASLEIPDSLPFVVLAHSGPAGLGSDPFSPCGRDWKSPAIDWGDTDLSIALHQIRRRKAPDLVVFGHTHHDLKRGNRKRITFVKDTWGTGYLNAACVPRKGKSKEGEYLFHFSWVEFVDNNLYHVSHRWFRKNGSIAYEDILFLNE